MYNFVKVWMGSYREKTLISDVFAPEKECALPKGTDIRLAALKAVVLCVRRASEKCPGYTCRFFKLDKL